MINFAQIKFDTLSVYFDTDQFKTSQKNIESIQSFFTLVSGKAEELKEVSIYGYCDGVGTNNYNLKLSENRIAEVRSVLEKSNYLTEDIEVKSLGNGSKYANADTEDASWRKVDLIIGYHLPLEKEEEEVQMIDLSEAKKGGKIILESLNFEGGRHILLPSSVPGLNKLYQSLLDNPEMKIEIQGHVCCTQPGKDGFDKDTKTFDLSNNRAKAVYDFLVEKGIDASRLSYVGMKGDFPLYPEDTVENMAKNRRVEVQIIDN